MTPYVDFDPCGDVTVRCAETNKALCYLPPCGPASGLKARERADIIDRARVIVAALERQEHGK